jgi:glutamyl-tRNA reductase
MLSELVLVHRTSPAPAHPLGAEGWFVWKTCLREIYLARRSSEGALETSPGDEVFYGPDAYRFLLEVLCGLHSRILGENEIVGQFKKRFLEEALPGEFADDFRRLAQALLADMKQVRREHPLNVGAHSYGSYCRKEAEGESRATLLGTGELALAIAPWLSRKAETQVLYRSENGRDSLARKISETNSTAARSLRFAPLANAKALDLSGLLVIAAPISAREIEALLAEVSGLPSKLVDLRGESAGDPLLPIALADGRELPVLDLQDFFREAETSNREASVLRAAALVRIARLTEARLESESILIRTYGWEDLCG